MHNTENFLISVKAARELAATMPNAALTELPGKFLVWGPQSTRETAFESLFAHLNAVEETRPQKDQSDDKSQING